MEEVDGILVAAHELKTPLMVIRQLALSLDGLDAEKEEVRAEMVNVSEWALRQVNDLAKIRRLEEGLFEMEPVAVRVVCDDVLRELAELLMFDRRKISVRYTNRSRLVTANRELLSSVIYNFLLNAMRCSDQEMKMELVASERRGKIRVAIRDFGPAISAKVLQGIKNETAQQPTSIAMRPGSGGLGLYIASKFAKYMEAEVGAVRHHDGTSFFVDLPVSRQMDLWSLQ